VTEEHAFTAAVNGGAVSGVEWYVDGVLGGNATVGVVTQANPATYTAPDAVPAPGSVLLTVVASENPSRLDSCRITVTFDTVFVDASAGNDTTGMGGCNKPFRSITRGMASAASGMTVRVAAGVYDDAIGEDFPISVGDGVSLEGEDWENCVVQLDAERLGERYALTLDCDDCSVRKLTLQEADPQPVYWNNAVQLSGCNRAHVDSLRCNQRANFAIIRVEHDRDSIVEHCRFVVTDGENEDRGLEIVFNEDGNGTILRNLTVSGYYVGIEFNKMQSTLVEHCTLSGNVLGVNLCCYLDEDSKPNPDFGGGARGSAGGNDFSGNSNCGLMNTTPNEIYAQNNTWTNTPPLEGADYCNVDVAGGGAVITE
jgi:hypothetical protein